MTSAADISPGLASALAAASLASQQAQRAADAFDAKQAVGLSAAPIPSQHWELLRVAELLTKGLNVAHVQQQQQQLSLMGAAAGNPPPLFLPSIAAHQGVVTATPGMKIQPGAPAAAGQQAVGGLAIGSLPLSVSAVMAGVTSAGLQMALASATQAAIAAKVAAAGVSPLHTEPQTPELAPGELRSPSFPVTGQREEAPTPQLPAKQGGPANLMTATTTLVRPVAVRPALPAGAVAMAQSSSPRAMSGAPTVISSALVPTATGSPGAAFSPVMRGRQPTTPSPTASCELPPAAITPGNGVGGRDPSPKPSPKPSPRLSTGSAKTAGSPMMHGLPAPPPLALSPRAAGVRKRRGGPVSPGRGASRASLDTTVSAAGLEGCADSMDCNDNGLEGEPTKGYKGRFCGRLFLKEDEKRLASECELLGPLIGFPGPGKRGHCTVAKLARAIVAGSVRRACESRVGEIQELKAQLAEAAAASDARAARLEAENAALRRELAARR